MKILVTGSEGFIGSHLVEKLVRAGHKVKSTVLYNSFNNYGWLENIDRKIFKEIEICFGDIRDFHFIKRSMKNCDAVVHLAALIGIPYSYLSPKSYVENNINGTLNVLQAAKELQLSKVIHTSTSEVYGSAEFIPMTEKHPLKGQSPYAASKIAADQLAKSFYLSYDTPVITLRPFNTFGPRQSMRAIIPTIAGQILKNNQTLDIGNIKTTRDFNYINDICDGFLNTLKIKNKKIYGETINLGSNKETSIENLIKEISKIIGVKVKVKVNKEKIRPSNSEVQRLCASNKKAKKLLNWKPKYLGKIGFSKALEETIEWYRGNLKHLKNSNKYVV